MRDTALAGATALLVACGGGDTEETQAFKAPSVTVIGDSLSDVGTFGLRHTVQAATGAPYPLWTEHLASLHTDTALCSFYRASSETRFEQAPECSSSSSSRTPMPKSAPAATARRNWC